MFLEGSRYAKVASDEVTTPDGRSVVAIRLRPLPPTPGEPHVVLDRDRLDLLAHDRYGDGTRFWRIADANAALEASTLVDETGETLDVPRGP